MPMPKGHRSERGYVTTDGFEGGLSYREIAEIMTCSDKKMNHSFFKGCLMTITPQIFDKFWYSFFLIF